MKFCHCDGLQQPYWVLLHSYGAVGAHGKCGQHFCFVTAGNADRAAAAAQVKDTKGDTLEYPKVIQSLPFWDTANTYFFNDDYTVTCNGQYTDQSGGKVGAHDSMSLALMWLSGREPQVNSTLCSACSSTLHH